MFLKRIELNGFKSFADKAIITFDHNVTGIVGPNGCGKSNITDAIRWVLGEQSAKSLRGDKMSDVIFAGSIDRKKVNMAEVTLVFDNTKKLIHHEADEVELTRRIYASEQSAEYLINHNPVRLKDVIDLVLDTGIGRDSLSMITQGNITEFAEAKPIDRRGIFEEAAGVSKYKKRKLEALNKLVHTKENLERCEDILSELERQISPLKRQAYKAQKYREKKKRLEEIEIMVLVDLIKQQQADIKQCKADLKEIEVTNNISYTSIQINENKTYEIQQNLNTLDNEINLLQGKLLQLVNHIQSLEAQKAQIDEKRKYVIEVGTNEQKIKELTLLLADSKKEFLNRQTRLQELSASLKLISDELSRLAMDALNFNNEKETSEIRLRNNERELDYLKKIKENPFDNGQASVKAIMNNKNNLRGVEEVVATALKPESGYEIAISTALGGALYNVITEDEQAAKLAIEFLKKNRLGKATFLPIRVLKARYVNNDIDIICHNFKGFKGYASEFVNYNDKFEKVVQALLQNILVCDTLQNAIELANMIHHRHKIVTLSGEIIHAGGAMTGGNNKTNRSIMTVEKEYNDLMKIHDSLQAKRDLANNKYLKALAKQRVLQEEFQNKKISQAKLETIFEAKKARYEKYQSELAMLKPKNQTETKSEVGNDDIIAKLNEAYQQRDEYTNQIAAKRELRISNNQEKNHIELQIRQLRKALDDKQILEKKAMATKIKLETQLEANLNRLGSEYQMTYEYASEKIAANEQTEKVTIEEVKQLRQEINALGNVNMNAPEQYQEVNERYEFIKHNYDELIQSRDQILNAIDKMDETMKKQFKETFDLINGELNNTFTELFGGGQASLVLENPDDILNTGIDIDVQPPGKSVKSIRLFSGGEKTLIAICVLFTILKVKPTPLVIFDEVEAALDQANVERFAKFVHNFANDTQFIIVTHRPGTMEECDVLYGVTMQNLGVSQMLKVELVDAIELAESKENN